MKFKFVYFIIHVLLAEDFEISKMIKSNEKECNREVLIAYGLKGLSHS